VPLDDEDRQRASPAARCPERFRGLSRISLFAVLVEGHGPVLSTARFTAGRRGKKRPELDCLTGG
jgi:hypothetical protein